MKIIVPGWEKVFNRRIQSLDQLFGRLVSAVLHKFHVGVAARAAKIGTGTATLPLLSQQIIVYERVLKDAAVVTKDLIVARQKDINREFVPIIAQQMDAAYVACEEESGKAIPPAHVEMDIAKDRIRDWFLPSDERSHESTYI